MRVRILSGNLAGCVQDEVPQVEGEVMVSTGYAELVLDEPLTPTEPMASEPPAAGPDPVPPASPEAMPVSDPEPSDSPPSE